MTIAGSDTHSYDANGNTLAPHCVWCSAGVTCRVEGGITYKQEYNTENLLVTVKKMSGTCASGAVLETTSFLYDGDGNLVKKTKPDGSNTIYIGGLYEVDKTSGGSVTRTVTYYPAGGAMRINISGGSNSVYYILKDHLGSASVVTDSTSPTPQTIAEQRYYPYGETRFTSGTINTDKLFTGQREMAGLGIYHYGARFYSPKLGRFLSADTIVPNYSNPQYLNRYSYVLGNPLRFTDPTGHIVACNEMDGDICEHDEPPPAPNPGPGGGGNCNNDPDCRNDDGGGNNDDNNGNDEITIGPTPPEPPIPDDPFEALEFWLNSYDWLQLLDEAGTWAQNYGRPAYRHIKGVIPAGFGCEAGIGASLSLIADLSNPNLSGGQKLGRAFVIGLEDGLIEVAASSLGRLAAPLGAEFGALVGAEIVAPGTLGTGLVPGAVAGGVIGGGVTFVAVSYGTTQVLDEIATNLNPSLFPGLFP